MLHPGVDLVVVVVFAALLGGGVSVVMVHMYRQMFSPGAVVVTHMCGVVMQVRMGPHSRRREMVDYVVQASLEAFQTDPFDSSVDRRFEELGFTVTVRGRTDDARRRFAKQQAKASARNARDLAKVDALRSGEDVGEGQ